MKNKKIVYSAGILATAGLAYLLLRRKSKQENTLPTADYVDVQRYLGKWYEIARLPTPFEKSCFNTTAEYSLNNDGSITIVNICNKGSVDGEIEKVEGRATLEDLVSNSKLKVEFLWPFKGDYWILHVDDQYQYAVVGEPSKKYLWILSRTSRIDDHIFDELLSIARERGYKTNELILTPHHL